MGVSKVIYGNRTIIDLTQDTVTADKLMQGYTAHGANGEQIVGTATGGSIQASKTVTAGTSNVTVTPDSGYDGIGQVTVQPTPSTSKTVDPVISGQTVNPDPGKLLSSVYINPINLISKKISGWPGKENTYYGSSDGALGYSDVKITGVKPLCIKGRTVKRFYASDSDHYTIGDTSISKTKLIGDIFPVMHFSGGWNIVNDYANNADSASAVLKTHDGDAYQAAFLSSGYVAIYNNTKYIYTSLGYFIFKETSGTLYFHIEDEDGNVVLADYKLWGAQSNWEWSFVHVFKINDDTYSFAFSRVYNASDQKKFSQIYLCTVVRKPDGALMVDTSESARCGEVTDSATVDTIAWGISFVSLEKENRNFKTISTLIRRNTSAGTINTYKEYTNEYVIRGSASLGFRSTSWTSMSASNLADRVDIYGMTGFGITYSKTYSGSTEVSYNYVAPDFGLSHGGATDTKANVLHYFVGDTVADTYFSELPNTDRIFTYGDVGNVFVGFRNLQMPIGNLWDGFSLYCDRLYVIGKDPYGRNMIPHMIYNPSGPIELINRYDPSCIKVKDWLLAKDGGSNLGTYPNLVFGRIIDNQLILGFSENMPNHERSNYSSSSCGSYSENIVVLSFSINTAVLFNYWTGPMMPNTRVVDYIPSDVYKGKLLTINGICEGGTFRNPNLPSQVTSGTAENHTKVFLGAWFDKNNGVNGRYFDYDVFRRYAYEY